MFTVTTEPMWLVYIGNDGEHHLQPWEDITTSGGLIDPDTGDDMEIVGWTTTNVPTK